MPLLRRRGLSSASYFFSRRPFAAEHPGTINTNFRTHQGDVGFLRHLKELGCGVAATDQWIEVSGGKFAEGDITASLEDLPDMVPTLAVLAAVRPGRTIIRKVAHLRIKESNRLEAIVRELTKDGHPGPRSSKTGSSLRAARPTVPTSRPTMITGSP